MEGTTGRTKVPRFWLQPTRSFLEGAPQRENFDSDPAFEIACIKYDREWRAEYECAGCSDSECPQCGVDK